MATHKVTWVWGWQDLADSDESFIILAEAENWKPKSVKLSFELIGVKFDSELI